MPVISIVSPVYRGEKMVHELVCRIQKNVSGFTEDYEIILVNDASPDNSWQAILQECSIDHRIKGINLSRNFGQHRAILSGLQYAKGDWVIVMDCDLQDKPEEISTLYKKALEGYDVVFAQRVERKDNLLKRMSSTIFYSVFRFLSGVKFDNQVANFGIYKQSVIRTVRNMPERDRSFPVQVSYVGFKTTHIPVTHGQRQEGGSSYTLKTLLKYASGIIISAHAVDGSIGLHLVIPVNDDGLLQCDRLFLPHDRSSRIHHHRILHLVRRRNDHDADRDCWHLHRQSL